MDPALPLTSANGAASVAISPVSLVRIFEKQNIQTALLDENYVCLELSAGFTALFPSCKRGFPVELTVADELQPGNLSIDALLNDHNNSISFVLNMERMVLSCEPIDNSIWALMVRSSLSEATNVHRYIQSREDMFSTSRTVSVNAMATTLAHEINTPIGTVKNLIQGLRSRLSRIESVPPELVKVLDDAKEQIQFSADIVKRVRDYTQERQLKKERLNSIELMNDSAELLDWYFSMHNCRLHIQEPEKPIYILGDRVMIQQVLMNLFKNAVDAMQSTPKDSRNIEVSLELLGRRCRFLIRDFGHGLKNAESVFMPFASDKPNGMGVGLSICRSFLELHGGRLWLSDASAELAPSPSGEPERGCVSVIELPVEENT